MTNYVPFASVGETLPAAETLPAWSTTPGEEQIYDLPNLHSWLQAGAPDGSGVYADRGQRGNNWLQATTASQPPILTNWRGTGQGAFNFDGASAYSIAGNFTLPPGEITIAAIVDFNASTSTGDGLRRVLLTSTATAASQYGFAQQNRKPALYATGLSTNLLYGSALAASAAHLLIFVWSGCDQEMAVSIDGGAFTAASIAATSLGTGLLKDTTCMLGGGNGANGSSTYAPWYGALAEMLVFSTSLKSAAEAGALALVVATLKAKYAIP